jgi:hypothetical protein
MDNKFCSKCGYIDTDNVQQLNKLEFFFYEWVIIEKRISEKDFSELTKEEIWKLKEEFTEFYINLK